MNDDIQIKKIIMIVGSGRSGSTLLDKALGSHSKCFSLGEIVNIHQEFKRAHRVLCGCSSLLEDCPFWNNLIRSIDREFHKTILEDPHAFSFHTGNGRRKLAGRANRLVQTLLLLTKCRTRTNPFLRKSITNTSILYDAVARQTGASVLIDSSKSLLRALAIERDLTQYKIGFIHLVRDGRAVLYSTQKGFYKVELYNELEKKSVELIHEDEKVEAETAINTWRKDNLKALLYLKLFRSRNSILVRYEDFALFPAATLKRICRFIGIPFESAMLRLDRKTNHMICGNPSRINAKKVEKPSQKWRLELDSGLLRLFNKKAGFLNRYLGYH
jgi:hypothetical protein